MPAHLELSLILKAARPQPVVAEVDQVLLLGYTGRNRANVVQHIEELAKLGVAPPPRVPMIYTVSSALLTTAGSIAVQSSMTSGEAELYLVRVPAGLCVGVASDHTDREQEAIDVTHSKGLCQKVLSREVWLCEEVAAHWDEVQLRAWATADGERRLYQDGVLAEFAPLPALLDEVQRAGFQALERTVILGGTLPLLGGFVYAQRFEAELSDPRTGRSLACSYDVVTPD